MDSIIFCLDFRGEIFNVRVFGLIENRKKGGRICKKMRPFFGITQIKGKLT